MDRSYLMVSSNGNNGLFKLCNLGILCYFFLLRKIGSFFEVFYLEFVWIFFIFDYFLLLFWLVFVFLLFFNCIKILL